MLINLIARPLVSPLVDGWGAGGSGMLLQLASMQQCCYLFGLGNGQRCLDVHKVQVSGLDDAAWN
jgi:hypothetical protein